MTHTRPKGNARWCFIVQSWKEKLQEPLLTDILYTRDRECKDRHVLTSGEKTPKPVYLVMWRLVEKTNLVWLKQKKAASLPQNKLFCFARRSLFTKGMRPGKKRAKKQNGDPVRECTGETGCEWEWAAVSTEIIKLRPRHHPRYSSVPERRVNANGRTLIMQSSRTPLGEKQNTLEHRLQTVNQQHIAATPHTLAFNSIPQNKFANQLN